MPTNETRKDPVLFQDNQSEDAGLKSSSKNLPDQDKTVKTEKTDKTEIKKTGRKAAPGRKKQPAAAKINSAVKSETETKDNVKLKAEAETETSEKAVVTAKENAEAELKAQTINKTGLPAKAELKDEAETEFNAKAEIEAKTENEAKTNQKGIKSITDQPAEADSAEDFPVLNFSEDLNEDEPNTEDESEKTASLKLKEEQDEIQAIKIQDEKPALSPIQQKIVDERKVNVLVSASAGSGKTTVLIERLCEIIITDRISLDQVLAVTFTEDAAASMKEKLKKRLQAEKQDDYIRTQLSLIETASISTIHRFCLDLVEKYYYQIPIPYSMASHVETGLLDAKALNSAYEKALESLDPARVASLNLFLENFGWDDAKLQKSILKFLEIARSKPDPIGWMNECRKVSPQTWDWFLDYFSLRMKILIGIMEEMKANIEGLSFSKPKTREEWLALFDQKAKLLNEAADHLETKEYEKFASKFLFYLANTGKFTPTINKVHFDSLQKDSRELEKEIGDVLFSMKALKEGEKRQEPLINTYIDLAIKTQDLFSEEKAEAGFIDFGDMEQFAHLLLEKEAVRKEIQDRYQIIMVDEYQDTNDLQESIIRAAAGDHPIFRVGDIKQSIYAFRQARPDLMRSLMKVEDENHQVLYMDENFRSKEHIIRFNNDFFNILMNTPGMPPQFFPGDLAKCGLESQKGKEIPVRMLYTQYGGWQDPDKPKTTDVQARSVHKKARLDLIAQDILKKRETENRDWRDFTVLTRAATNHNDIKECFEAWGIPLISKAKRGFYTNQAIQIVLASLKAIVNPRDDIALMAMLASPIGKSSQKEIADAYAAAANKDSGSLYDTLRNHPILDGYEKIARMKSLPLGELVAKLYNWNQFYYRKTTAQDKTNLDLLLEKASAAENEMTLAQFVELMSMEEDFNETGEAMPFGKEDDVVKVTTIHSSKGLEYDVVYVLTDDQNRDMEDGNPIYLDSDLGISLMALSDNRHIKEKTMSHIAFKQKRFMDDQMEKMRLLYVAATRAIDELVFVDTIKSEAQFNEGMDLRAIWANQGFTSWVARIFLSHPEHPLFVMEEKELPKRPQAKKQSKYIGMKTWKGTTRPILSQTASSSKISPVWKPVKIGSSKGMERGTLFHTLAHALAYPYDKEAARKASIQYGLELDESSLLQLLSLNDCKQYQSWMQMEHQFEAPFAIMDNNTLSHGYMDFLVMDPENNEIHVLDFKTDAVFDLVALEKKYAAQLAVYQNALQKIYPDMKVRKWLYSFHFKDIWEIV